MRTALALLFTLMTTPVFAQASNWWGGSASGTGYPINATPITASATGTTAAVSVTLPGVVGKTTFICGWSMTSGGTTTAAVGTATVAGVIGGTLSYVYVAAATGLSQLIVRYPPVCLPANGQNASIVVTQPAGGTGTTAAVTAYGYQL